MAFLDSAQKWILEVGAVAAGGAAIAVAVKNKTREGKENAALLAGISVLFGGISLADSVVELSEELPPKPPHPPRIA